MADKIRKQAAPRHRLCPICYDPTLFNESRMRAHFNWKHPKIKNISAFLRIEFPHEDRKGAKTR